MTKTRRLYHGTHPLLAPVIEMEGLKPHHGYAWVTASERLAWQHGAWAAAMALVAKTEVPPLPRNPTPMTVRVWEILAGGMHVAAVVVVEPPAGARDLVYKPEAAPPLPWEEDPDPRPRACYRSSRPIPPEWVREIRFFKVPELRLPSVLREIRRRAEIYENVMPRGKAVEDILNISGIRHATYNPRRLVAAVVDACPEGWSDDRVNGLRRAVRTAERGLELACGETHLGVVLIYALVHLAGPTSEVERLVDELDNRGDLAVPVDQRRLLDEAIARRNENVTTEHPTIGCCWDAERLDGLDRNEQVDLSVLSTEPGREMARAGARMHVMDLARMFEEYRDRLGTTATINGLNAIPIPGSDEIAVLHPTVS